MEVHRQGSSRPHAAPFWLGRHGSSQVRPQQSHANLLSFGSAQGIAGKAAAPLCCPFFTNPNRNDCGSRVSSKSARPCGNADCRFATLRRERGKLIAYRGNVVSTASKHERRIKLDPALEGRNMGKDLIVKSNQMKQSSFSRSWKLVPRAERTW